MADSFYKIHKVGTQFRLRRNLKSTGTTYLVIIGLSF